MEPASNNKTSLELVDEILMEFECPISLERMNLASSLPCTHNVHTDSAKEYFGEDPDHPKANAKCPLCLEPVTYWKQNYAIQSLVPKIEQLQKKMLSEEQERLEQINRFKSVEDHWIRENPQMEIMQKLHQGESNSHFSRNYCANNEKLERKLELNSLLFTIMSLFPCILPEKHYDKVI